MGEVEAEHVGARVNKTFDSDKGVAGRTEGGDNLGAPPMQGTGGGGMLLLHDNPLKFRPV
jgi:hypothetical protein